MNLNKINRLEIIDHTPCFNCEGRGTFRHIECSVCGGLGAKGRSVVFWENSKQIDMEIQDNEQTMKIFIHPRYEQ